MRTAGVLLIFIFTAGCGPIIEKRFFPKPTEQEMAREVNRLGQTGIKNSSVQAAAIGSIWPADDHVFFYADRKALRVGDIITVSIIENASANNTADTDLSRTSSIEAGLSTFFGKEKFLKLF